MKWPFVRRSKYELLKDDSNFISEALRIKTEYISKLEDQIEIYRKLHDEYAQLNHDNLHEINRLNQELAGEFNHHGETRDHNKRLFAKNETLEKELEETKAHEQKLFEAHDKLNQQNMGLLYEVEEWKKISDCWMGKAARAKSEILKVRGYLKTIAKKL